MSDEPMLPGRPYLLKIGARNRERDHHGAEIQGQRKYAWSIWRPKGLP